MISQKDIDLFENLFVLELANNHWGSLSRGLKIIQEHGTAARTNQVKAAIKLQFRDVDEFIHKNFKGTENLRYIKKTEQTKLQKNDFARMIEEIRHVGCIPIATPFDESSVDLCVEYKLPIIKIASSDVNDWVLIEKIASTRLPVIVSSGGAQEHDLDQLVYFFEHRDIPLAINHCVSLYPSEDHELHLDQIDYLRKRYPSHIIGLSTHEYHDWHSSMLISYGKGARTWERHIDIDQDDIPVSSYCSLPHQCDAWFKAFHKAREMCGGYSDRRRVISRKETEYLDTLVRGLYARKDLAKGHVITKESLQADFYYAIPLHKGQLSCREIVEGHVLQTSVPENAQLTIHNTQGACTNDPRLRSLIENRGI